MTLNTIVPTAMPLDLGGEMPGFYCCIFDPKGESLDIHSDCFLTIREDAIAHTKKIIDSISHDLN